MPVNLPFRLILVLLIVGTGYSACATVISGGSLTYRYVGDSTGIPYQYELILEYYNKENVGTATPDSVEVSVNSSCFAPKYFSLYKVVATGSNSTLNGGVYFPDYLNCGNTSTPLVYASYTYRGWVTLDGACPDFVFRYSSCCRDTNLVNINSPAATSFALTARLNNSIGSNDSPFFIDLPVHSFALNKGAFSFHTAHKNEGDSIIYEIISIKSDSGVAYSPGYSYSNPVSSSVPVVFDIDKGTLGFTPNAAGLYNIAVAAKEYRLDSNWGLAVLVGWVMRDFNIKVTPNGGTSYDGYVFGDSLSGKIYTGISCGDSILNIEVDPILVSSLDASGSDFFITNRLGDVLPILEAGGYTDGTSGVTEKLWIKLGTSIQYNDTLTLTARVGMDGNTFINMCGDAFPAKGEALVVIHDCQGWVTIPGDGITVPEIRFYPNPVEEVLNVRYAEADPPKSMHIYDLRGNLLISITGVVNRIELGMLAKGVYILMAEFPSQSVVERIIVE